MKVKADYSQSYQYSEDVVDVDYSFREVTLNFEDDLKVKLNPEQFKIFREKMNKLHDEVFGA